MQIEAIKINNYRGLKEVTFDPGKINVFTGANGSGKTSVLEAISFLLTGKANGDCVHNGAESANVSGVIMGTPVERRMGARASIRVNGKATTQKSVAQWLEDATGATVDTLHIATASGILAAMDARQLAEYLINNNLIPVTVDMDTMKMLCTVSEDAATELEMMMPAMPEQFGLPEVQEAYEHYFAARPALKKQLAELRAKANCAVPKPTHTMEEIDAAMNRIAANMAEHNAYVRQNQVYMNAERAAHVYREQLAAITDQINKTKVEPVNPAEVQALKERRRQAEAARREALGAKKTVEANISLFSRTLENLDKPVCPISNKLVCTTDKTAIRTELQQLVTENRALAEAAQKREADAANEIQTIDVAMAELDKRNAAYQQYHALCARKQAMEAAPPVIPPKPEPPKAIENAEALAASLKAERDALFAHRVAEQAAAQIPFLEKRLAVCEELVALLRPQGGIREKIVEAAFEPLIDHCNSRAETLRPGFAINMVSNNGIHIMCRPRSSAKMLPLSNVSAGEQALAMVLVMDAINALSGAGILMLDDLDKLDSIALDSLLQLLCDPSVTACYDHIFLAAVNHDDTMRVLDKHNGKIDLHFAL